MKTVYSNENPRILDVIDIFEKEMEIFSLCKELKFPTRYSYGSSRASTNEYKKHMENVFKKEAFTITSGVTDHAFTHGIGNNEGWYIHDNLSDETIGILVGIDDMYGNCICYIDDVLSYKRISNSYEFNGTSQCRNKKMLSDEVKQDLLSICNIDTQKRKR